MAGGLTWTVTDTTGCAIVAVRGLLDLPGTPGLRTALLKCLAEQPAALLVDVAAMELADEMALTVFTVITRQAARWPGTPVMLCGPSGRAKALLDRGRAGRLAIFADVDAAVLAVGEGRSAVLTFSDQLMPIAGAVRYARNLTTEACLRWDLPDLVGPAGLVVSELVANAVEHAATMLTVQISRRSRYVHIAVRDGSSQEPRLNPPVPATAQRGRGLLLVDNVATHWGFLPSRDGKVVWATLAVEQVA